VLAALVSVMAQFLPDDGPGQSGDFRVSPTFFLVLLGLGFLIGTLGHIVKSKTLIAAGILLIFAATIFVPLAYTISN
jgi:hypothetical protein